MNGTRLAASPVNRPTRRISGRRSPCGYLVDHPAEKNVIFVSDFATGKMILAEHASFVPTINRDNGERDFVAFKDRATASTEAAALQTSPMTWPDVLAQVTKQEKGN